MVYVQMLWSWLIHHWCWSLHSPYSFSLYAVMIVLDENVCGDVSLHCSLSHRTLRHVDGNVDRDRCVTSISLNFDLEHISSWGSNNLATSSASRSCLLSISLMCHSFSRNLPFDSSVMGSTYFVSLLDLLIMLVIISELASRAVRKVFFTPVHFLLHEAWLRFRTWILHSLRFPFLFGFN